MKPIPTLGRGVEHPAVDGIPKQPGYVLRWHPGQIGGTLQGGPCGHLATDGDREHQFARGTREPFPWSEHRAHEVLRKTCRKSSRVTRKALDEEPVQVCVATGAGLHLGDQ